MQMCDKAMGWEGGEIERDTERETGTDRRERQREIEEHRLLKAGFTPFSRSDCVVLCCVVMCEHRLAL